MNYTVVWTQAAERRLTQLWLGSRIRAEIRRAADEIDAALARNPHDCGESRDEGRRIVLVFPLGVLVDIDEAQRQVRVLSVWNF